MANALPMWAIYKGKRVRIVDYRPTHTFIVLLADDTKLAVARRQLTFIA